MCDQHKNNGIETSGIGSDMYYYDKQTPVKIANTIMAVDMQDSYDGREKIQRLDTQFCADLKRVLEE